jgi:hypothetical protein
MIMAAVFRNETAGLLGGIATGLALTAICCFVIVLLFGKKKRR